MQLVSVRLPDSVKDELEEIAKSQHRPLGNLCRIVLLRWLEEYRKHGKLEFPEGSYEE